MRARADVLSVSILCASLALACGKNSDPTGEASNSGGSHVSVGEHGFVPTSLSLPKGTAGSTAPVTFVRTTDETCAKEVVFPDLGIKKDLPLNKPVIVDVPTESPRTLTFQCGMAMYKGALVVK